MIFSCSVAGTLMLQKMWELKCMSTVFTSARIELYGIMFIAWSFSQLLCNCRCTKQINNQIVFSCRKICVYFLIRFHKSLSNFLIFFTDIPCWAQDSTVTVIYSYSNRSYGYYFQVTINYVPVRIQVLCNHRLCKT